MRTKQQYIERLSKMRRNLYLNGEKVDRTDPIFEPTLNTIGLTFDYAAHPDYQDLCTATSHLTGEKINRFTHIHHSTDDLHKKQDMTRVLCQIAGGCIQRCMVWMLPTQSTTPRTKRTRQTMARPSITRILSSG